MEIQKKYEKFKKMQYKNMKTWGSETEPKINKTIEKDYFDLIFIDFFEDKNITTTSFVNESNNEYNIHIVHNDNRQVYTSIDDVSDLYKKTTEYILDIESCINKIIKDEFPNLLQTISIPSVHRIIIKLYYPYSEYDFPF